MKAATKEKKERKIAAKKIREKTRQREGDRELEREREEGRRRKEGKEGRKERGRSSASFVTSSGLVSARDEERSSRGNTQFREDNADREKTERHPPKSPSALDCNEPFPPVSSSYFSARRAGSSSSTSSPFWPDASSWNGINQTIGGLQRRWLERRYAGRVASSTPTVRHECEIHPLRLKRAQLKNKSCPATRYATHGGAGYSIRLGIYHIWTLRAFDHSVTDKRVQHASCFRERGSQILMDAVEHVKFLECDYTANEQWSSNGITC